MRSARTRCETRTCESQAEVLAGIDREASLD